MHGRGDGGLGFMSPALGLLAPLWDWGRDLFNFIYFFLILGLKQLEDGLCLI